MNSNRDEELGTHSLSHMHCCTTGDEAQQHLCGAPPDPRVKSVRFFCLSSLLAREGIKSSCSQEWRITVSFNPWKKEVLSLIWKLPKFYSFIHLLLPHSMLSHNTDIKICPSMLPQASLCPLKPAGHQQPSRWSLLQIPHPPSSLIQEQTHFSGLASIHKELIVLTKLIALHLALPDVLQRHSNILYYNVLFKVHFNVISHKYCCTRQAYNYEPIPKINTKTLYFWFRS